MSNFVNGEVWRSPPVRAAVLISSLIALTACGGGGVGGGGGGGISGKVTGPTGSNLNQTVVAAFVCANACQAQTDISNTVSAQTVITATGSSASYALPTVPADKYFVLAVQDTNGSKTVDSGDLLGAVSGVPSPAANVNIELQPAAISGAGDPSPTALARRLLRQR